MLSKTGLLSWVISFETLGLARVTWNSWAMNFRFQFTVWFSYCVKTKIKHFIGLINSQPFFCLAVHLPLMNSLLSGCSSLVRKEHFDQHIRDDWLKAVFRSLDPSWTVRRIYGFTSITKGTNIRTSSGVFSSNGYVKHIFCVTTELQKYMQRFMMEVPALWDHVLTANSQPLKLSS